MRLKFYFLAGIKTKLPIILIGIILLILDISPGIALFLGLTIAWFGWNPHTHSTSKWAKYLLNLVIILMGFGMSIQTVLVVGSESLLITFISIASLIGLGLTLTKFLSIPKKLGVLLSCGTAICGGSAIAAIGPSIKAHRQEMAVSLGIVFLLNGLALWIFPLIGNLTHLSQNQFGWWAALAIHDTSSVVGACAEYGSESLQTGTLIKLTRALWIIPLAFIAPKLLGKTNANLKSETKINIPWPLVGFLLASILVSILPKNILIYTQELSSFSKSLMTLVLFWIGASLSRSEIKECGIRPFIMAIVLWIFAASLSFTFIYFWL